MKIIASFFVFLILFISAAKLNGQTGENHKTAKGKVYNDINMNGKMETGEPGLAGVCVSNGINVVLTDEEGNYSLPVSNDDIIYVIKPGNYSYGLTKYYTFADYYINKPKGSPKLKYEGVAPTGPLPDEINFPLSEKAEPDSFDVVLFGDPQTDSQDDINSMQRLTVEELWNKKFAFGVTLGDIAFDNLGVFGSERATVALMKKPWFYIFGNHDENYKASENRYRDETFEKYFGPSTYAFNYGDVHFIALNTVHYLGHKRYDGMIGKEQMEFIRNDLKYVPKNKLVVFMMHIPFTELKDREELYSLIEDRPYTFSIAGHWHMNAQMFLSKKDGWNGAKDHHILVAGAVCGGLWQGEHDEYGIAQSLLWGGAPKGYWIASFSGNKYSLRYKPSQRAADWQMNIWVPEENLWDPAMNLPPDAPHDEVLANVFAGSPKTIVKMRVDGGDWQTMKLVDRPDPNLQRIFKLQARGIYPSKKSSPYGGKHPAKSPHLWLGKIPKGLSSGPHLIEVSAKNDYGLNALSSRVVRVK